MQRKLDPNRPKVPDVLPLANAYYDSMGCSGGNLHIVIADGNIGNDHIQWCRDLCVSEEDEDGIELCDLLLKMSITGRHKIYLRSGDYMVRTDQPDGSSPLGRLLESRRIERMQSTLSRDEERQFKQDVERCYNTSSRPDHQVIWDEAFGDGKKSMSDIAEKYENLARTNLI